MLEDVTIFAEWENVEDKERVLVGNLNYREIDFDFILRDKILKLIASEDKKIQVLAAMES